MCNLYSMTRSRDEVRRWFGVSDNRAAAFGPADAFFPGYAAPVVRLGQDPLRRDDRVLQQPPAKLMSAGEAA